MTLRRLKPDNCHPGPEWKFQAAAIRYIKTAHKDLTPVHVPSEGKRNGMQQRVLKEMGLTAGIPDILIFDVSMKYIGLAIELKIWPNKATEKQIEFMELLERNGWLTGVCYSIEQVIALLDRYK